MESIRIVDRDRLIIREIDRWRVCLGRHIKELAGFTGQRACDRRLRKLINAGYIKKKESFMVYRLFIRLRIKQGLL